MHVCACAHLCVYMCVCIQPYQGGKKPIQGKPQSTEVRNQRKQKMHSCPMFSG